MMVLWIGHGQGNGKESRKMVREVRDDDDDDNDNDENELLYFSRCWILTNITETRGWLFQTEED